MPIANLTISGQGTYDIANLLTPTEQNNPVNIGTKDISSVYWRPSFTVTSFDPLKTTFTKSNPSEYRFGRIAITYFDKVTDRFYLNFEKQFGNLIVWLPREYYDVGADVTLFSFVVNALKELSGNQIHWDLTGGVTANLQIVALRSATVYSVGGWV